MKRANGNTIKIVLFIHAMCAVITSRIIKRQMIMLLFRNRKTEIYTNHIQYTRTGRQCRRQAAHRCGGMVNYVHRPVDAPKKTTTAVIYCGIHNKQWRLRLDYSLSCKRMV